MELKEYMAPEMEVVELKYQPALLAGSGEDEGFIEPLGRRATSALRPRFIK